MDTKNLMERLGRFDNEIFEQSKHEELSDADIKKKIHETVQRLDKFPRKSRHSQEWYNKYSQKFSELTGQSDSLVRTEDSIKLLLTELDHQKG